jgi:hypothetical protein
MFQKIQTVWDQFAKHLMGLNYNWSASMMPMFGSGIFPSSASYKLGGVPGL